MKRSKFSDSQIIDSVKGVESGVGVPDIYRELGLVRPLSISGGLNMVACMSP